MHEQYCERFAFVLSEALLAGWSGRFDSASAALRGLRDGDDRFRGDRALTTALLAIAAAATGQTDQARRLSRRAISESTQQRGPEAAFERRMRIVARYVAAATCHLIGDSIRGDRGLSATFDPEGRLRTSLGEDGVDVERLPRLMHGYALYINAAFMEARRLRPAHGLTPVEVEVLRSLPTGGTVAQIAADRGKSKKTIERQVESIYAKLGAKNRTEAINRARESGLLR
jgi:DNA-binding CsgD family transcriptional regulator